MNAYCTNLVVSELAGQFATKTPIGLAAIATATPPDVRTVSDLPYVAH